MNLSRWEISGNSEKIVHPAAKLSDIEAREIYQWTRAERRRLNDLSEDESPEE